MQNRLSTTFLALAALGLPTVALANVTGTTTLQANGRFSLDTGTTVTSGGDLSLTGGSITVLGTAKDLNVTALAGLSGTSGFNELTQQILSSFSSLASTAAITPAANTVIGVLTNGGNYAAVLITAVTSSSVSFQYITYETASGGNIPTISAVQDAGSYTANIAQGSIFVVKGSGLSASGLTQPPFPLPTSTGGVSISFTPQSGGSPTLAFIVYLYNESGVNQLAAVLPSSVPVGMYNVTVTNSGSTSSPFTVQVVKQKPGLLSVDESGNGLVVAQNFISQSELDLDRYTTGTIGSFTTSPSHPLETVIAYSVGMGPDPGPDNVASPGYNFLTNGGTVLVYVGGMTITPTYAGRVAGGTGYEQINFVLPSNVTTGCAVTFQISVNGVMSQVVYLSIATAGANACVQPGYTTSQLQSFDQGTTFTTGGFTLLKEAANEFGQSVALSTVDGDFAQYSGFELAAIPANIQSIITNQGCTVIQITPTTTTATPGSTITFLDAGKVTLTGPTGSSLNNTQIPELSNVYELSINGPGSTLNGNIVAGTYTLNGSGGTGVGPFTATVTLPTPLTITGGLPATVTRSAGLTINWTGGNSSDFVEIFGSAVMISNGSAESGAEFICITTAGTGGINISSSILNQLPAITAAQIAAVTAEGSLSVFSGTGGANGNGVFTAPLVAGGSITNAVFTSSSDTSASVVYQ